VIGLICDPFVKEIEADLSRRLRGVSPQHIADEAFEQFTFQTKVLTLEAMQSAGLL